MPWLQKPPAFAPPSAPGDDQFEILGVFLLRVATRKRVSSAGTANPFSGIDPLELATGCVYKGAYARRQSHHDDGHGHDRIMGGAVDVSF